MLVAVVWGSLAVAVILTFNYMFEVNIHWKEGRQLNQNFDPLTVNIRSLQSSSSNYEALTNKDGEKTQSMPIHNQDSPVKDCAHPLCTRHLSRKERFFFNNCTQKTIGVKAKFGPILNASCHFQNGSDRGPVALASFPGSGNTWVRGLLERTTGVCTGAYVRAVNSCYHEY